MKYLKILLICLLYSQVYSQSKVPTFMPFAGFQVQGTSNVERLFRAENDTRKYHLGYGFRMLGGVYVAKRVGLVGVLGHRHYLKPGRSVLYGAGQVRFNFEKDIWSNYLSASLGYNFENNRNLFAGNFFEVGFGFTGGIGDTRISLEPIVSYSYTELDVEGERFVEYLDIGLVFTMYLD